MRKIRRIAQREWAEIIRTKTFVLGVLLVPAMIALVAWLTGRFATAPGDGGPDRRVVVTDRSEALSAELKAAFDAHNASHPRTVLVLEDRPAPRGGQGQAGGEAEKAFAEEQRARVRRGEVYAYVVVDDDVVEGKGRIRIHTRDARAADLGIVSTLEHLFYRAVVNRRCALRSISPELLAELRRRVPMEQTTVGPKAEGREIKTAQRIARMMTPFAFMFLMFMGMFGVGFHMATGVIEEKSSRVIEVLLSAVSPFELMAGKILGLAGAGLVVVGLWGGAAYLVARSQDVSFHVALEIMPHFLVYYVLGFLLLSAILAAIGSLCTTVKEAQGLIMPINLLLVVPMVSWYQLVQQPNGVYARILSYLPPLTPMVMILRLSASSEIALAEVIGTMVLLAASVPGVIWAAAKVFRVGILMYGKRPRLAEVFHWLREK